jgi:cytidylate kinase
MEVPKKHIITIGGRPSSGKSSTAKAVAAALGYDHFSSGDLFRQLGKEHGIDVLQANIQLEKDANLDIDKLVDGRLQEIGRTKDNQVIDSRTAWHWIPNSYKVFLDLDLRLGAERVLSTMDEARRKSEHLPEDPAEYVEYLQARLDSETRRYRNLYDIDPYDMSNYDLVVDTSKYQLNEVVELVLNGFQSWIAD